MKKIFTLSVLLLLSRVLLAQAPQGIHYQGVARNAGGTPYNNQTMSVRLTVRSGTPTGTLEYSEVRSATTNAFGLFTLQIGSAGAESITGNFATINWNNGSKFLQTEIKLPGQASYTDLGTTQMMSVPYAINSLQTRQLSLPFDTTVNTNVNNKGAFQIKNTSLGPYEAIRGESVNGTGLLGASEKSDGVTGFSQSATRAGVAGSNAVDGGFGVKGIIANSNAAGSGVYGYGGYGIGVKGESVLKTGVEGRSTNAAGVTGHSENNHGISGSSNEPGKAGVHGIATGNINGQIGVMGEAFGPSTGVLAKNTYLNGLALDVYGKLKIAGNGQTPGTGKVLTSDENGNASWQSLPKVAFKLVGAYPHGVNNYAQNNWYKVYYHNEEYDYGNNISTGVTITNSEFVAPINGLYHFDASIVLNSGIYVDIALIKLPASGGQQVISINQYGEVQKMHDAQIGGDPTFHVTGDTRLAKGDKVIVRIYWRNGHISDTEYTHASSITSSDSPQTTIFSGHLVFAD